MAHHADPLVHTGTKKAIFRGFFTNFVFRTNGMECIIESPSYRNTWVEIEWRPKQNGKKYYILRKLGLTKFVLAILGQKISKRVLFEVCTLVRQS